MSNSTDNSPIILNYGFEENWMINDIHQEKVILENAYVLTTIHDISTQKLIELTDLFEEVRQNNASLVLMAPKISEDALRVLEQNKNNNYLETVFIRSPLVDYDNTKKIIKMNNKYDGLRVLDFIESFDEIDSLYTARVPYIEVKKDKTFFSDNKDADFSYSKKDSDSHNINIFNDQISHNQSLKIIDFLKELAGLRYDLRDVERNSMSRENIIEDVYFDADNRAHNELYRQIEHYRNERDLRVLECDNQLNAYLGIINNKKAKVNSLYESGINFIRKISETEAKRARAKGDQELINIGRERDALLNQLDNEFATYREYNRSLIEEANNDCRVYESQAQTECNNKIAEAKSIRDRDIKQNDNTLNTQINTLIRDYSNRIDQEFNRKILRNYSDRLNRMRFDGNNYQIPTEVPEAILLGNINYRIPNNGREDREAIDALESQVKEFSYYDNNDFVISLPYAQRIIDGISLLIRYDEPDRLIVQDLIQPLLLKLFLSLPPGKLEATMIDPLELGANFSDIPKLATGSNAARIIDTKIWSKEKDIERALADLRLRVENMTQAYGEDFETRLRKEPIKVLAITDFPVGFNESALKDLRAIVRNSNKLGVFIIITVNENELSKLKERHEALISEITSNLFETKANGSQLTLTNPKYSNTFIQLDPMIDVLRSKEQILSEFSEAIDHSKGPIEPFEDMFIGDIYDSSTWFKGEPYEFSVPIGIKGADNIINMVLGRSGGSVEHHALVTGNTGSGKSTFFHTLIMSTLLTYRPEDVQMYLLDFKEGVEFKPYTSYRLPSLKVVALNSEREFGLNVLKELNDELERRGRLFSRNLVSDINEYNIKIAERNPNVPILPKLVMIFDEVQELFRERADRDSISREALSYLNRLVTQGRGMGIHVILASQDFSHAPGLEKYFSQMSVRIAVAGTEKGAASILDNSKDIESLQKRPTGSAIYNNRGGAESHNNFFQISYLEDENRTKLLKELDKFYSRQERRYKDQQTRVLLTAADDDVNNYFNKFIYKKEYEPISNSLDSKGLFLGQGFGPNNHFTVNLDSSEGSNLLVVTKNEEIAQSIFDLSIISYLHEELRSDRKMKSPFIYIIDLADKKLDEEDLDFSVLKEEFYQQIKIALLKGLNDTIKEVYDRLVKRAEGRENTSEKILFMFFGLNRARKLMPENIYDSEFSEELGPVEMLKEILSKGPRYGINSIVWSEGIREVEAIFGNRFGRMFNKRIAFNLDKDVMNSLVAETEDLSHEKTAVYFDIEEDIKNTHFRPYEIPSKYWLDIYARSYAHRLGDY